MWKLDKQEIRLIMELNPNLYYGDIIMDPKLIVTYYIAFSFYATTQQQATAKK